jgi:uncharacterized LabA/DUF88 family protein
MVTALPDRPTHYLFVDGGCVRATFDHYCREFFGGQELPINIAPVLRGYDKAFYYDSLPPQKREETESDYLQRISPIQELFESLSNVDGLHVYLGTTKFRRKIVEQKQVDIMIAVHMLSHCHRGNMQRATLLASDLDFKPLIDALVQDGMHVTLWHPPFKTNRELVKAADSRQRFDVQTAHAMLPSAEQVRFPLPSGTSQGLGNVFDTWSTLCQWRCDKHGRVSLHFKDGRFGVQFPSLANRGHRVSHQHTDVTFLRKVLMDTDGLEWPESELPNK